jgi:hypothetical protein
MGGDLSARQLVLAVPMDRGRMAARAVGAARRLGDLAGPAGDLGTPGTDPASPHAHPVFFVRDASVARRAQTAQSWCSTTITLELADRRREPSDHRGRGQDLVGGGPAGRTGAQRPLPRVQDHRRHGLRSPRSSSPRRRTATRLVQLPGHVSSVRLNRVPERSWPPSRLASLSDFALTIPGSSRTDTIPAQAPLTSRR